jgi:hypothetical protein
MVIDPASLSLLPLLLLMRLLVLPLPPLMLMDKDKPRRFDDNALDDHGKLVCRLRTRTFQLPSG